MKKTYLIFLILSLLISCENKDLIIQKSKNNCGCYQKIKSFIDISYYSECNFRYPWDKSCSNDPYSIILSQSSKQVSQSNEIFSKTNTIELVNNSRTKVYKVLIQIFNNGKISYLKYKIEPTQIITLGCDSNFKINYDRNKAREGNCAEAVYLSNLSKNKIEYNIHKIELISEY